jgi:hypothetical protein
MSTNYYLVIVDKYGEVIRVHIGKRSGGWSFCWDHNDWEYYKDVGALLSFLLTGRIESDYESDLPFKSFLAMALNWSGAVGCQDQVIHGFRFNHSTNFT